MSVGEPDDVPGDSVTEIIEVVLDESLDSFNIGVDAIVEEIIDEVTGSVTISSLNTV